MSRQLAAVLLVAAGLLLIAPLAHGTTLYVAINGLDGLSCGPVPSPCRSITQGIANAVVGDTIIVGPGVYGDLDGDGTPGDSPGEETPSPGCGCMLSVNKGVTIVSSDGAAATIIDARTAQVNTNVLIIADGVTFGKPGKGFTVTATTLVVSEDTGIAVDATNVSIQGNQILNVSHPARGRIGIDTVDNDGETILIQGNEVVGWSLTGIQANSSGKTISKNHVASIGFNLGAPTGFVVGNGIFAAKASIVVGNVVTGSVAESFGGEGIDVSDSVKVVGNAVYGKFTGILVFGPSFSGTIAKNNLVGNACGLDNESVDGLLAANNYWGAATGPGSPPGRWGVRREHDDGDAVCDQALFHQGPDQAVRQPVDVLVDMSAGR
jgi:hypothetical protein